MTAGEQEAPGREVNFKLLGELAKKPHKLLNIADDFEAQIRDIPIAWTGEVFQETRTAHHLLDMVGVPQGRGDRSRVDARTFLAITEISDLRERLARISTWHSREAGPAGMVGDFCTECDARWPCATRRMADGTYVDEEPSL
jgi:hypothetical protein